MSTEPQIDHLESLCGYLKVSDDQSDAFYRRQARALVQLSSGVVEALAALAPAPSQTVLQQQRRPELTDVEALAESVYELRRELAVAEAHYLAARTATLPEHDPDERGAQEDTDRISAEIAAEKAGEGMPRLAS